MPVDKNLTHLLAGRVLTEDELHGELQALSIVNGENLMLMFVLYELLEHIEALAGKQRQPRPVGTPTGPNNGLFVVMDRVKAAIENVNEWKSARAP